MSWDEITRAAGSIALCIILAIGCGNMIESYFTLRFIRQKKAEFRKLYGEDES